MSSFDPLRRYAPGLANRWQQQMNTDHGMTLPPFDRIDDPDATEPDLCTVSRCGDLPLELVTGGRNLRPWRSY